MTNVKICKRTRRGGEDNNAVASNAQAAPGGAGVRGEQRVDEREELLHDGVLAEVVVALGQLLVLLHQ